MYFDGWDVICLNCTKSSGNLLHSCRGHHDIECWILSVFRCSTDVAPTIENADRAIATASKLSVGSYVFKLVVKDEEGLTGEDTVKITVKEGRWSDTIWTVCCIAVSEAYWMLSRYLIKNAQSMHSAYGRVMSASRDFILVNCRHAKLPLRFWQNFPAF